MIKETELKKEPIVCNLIIVDASGSMKDKKSDVIGGLKELLDLIKTKSDILQKTIIVQFSDTLKVLVNSNQANIETDIIDAYSPKGGTALLDAIGESFKLVPDYATAVYVSIITDGEENQSRKYSSLHVKDLITEKSKNNWLITFMGTTEEAVLSARNLGVNSINTMSFSDTSKGIKLSSSVRNKSMSNFYSDVERGLSVTSNVVPLETIKQNIESEEV